MYRQGLGDCFLLTLQQRAKDQAHVLIDMGTIGKTDGYGVEMPEVAKDIAATTQPLGLSAVVATHEHADHLSGFKKLAAAGVRAGEAWFAWTEDPSDPLAREIEKYKGDLFTVAERAACALEARQNAFRVALRQCGALAAREAEQREAFNDIMNEGIRDLLRFNGLSSQENEDAPLAAAARAGGLKKTLQEMMEAVRNIAGRRVRFCSPGDVLEPAWAPGVRFYVLGPPRSAKAIKQRGEHGAPDLYELAFVVGEKQLPSAGGAPFDQEAHDSWEPFDSEYMYRFGKDVSALGDVVAAYEREPWRKIEEATTGAAAELALQLDNATNNTSLVLAIEVGGEVLLFPGDAQLGSWLTWRDVKFTVSDAGRRRIVTGADLLRRTTFYKVGHHASHNATAVPGLELMGERGLMAFIPLDEKVARNRHWPMPARKLYARLEEKTRGRVLKSDPDADQARVPGVTVTKGYVEVTLPLPAG